MKQDWLKQLDELDVDSLCINTLRTLAIDMIQKADSGHPGAPMGCAPMAYLLWSKHMKHNPKDPHWFDRDRFVLFNGHGLSLLYSLLHLSGYAVSLDDLKNFRQWGSITPGHPENHLTPGVETTTGPLGQGFCNAVGFALAEANLAARYNKDGHTVIDHHTYAIVGDGCLMEGVTSEAASLVVTSPVPLECAAHESLSLLVDAKRPRASSLSGGRNVASAGKRLTNCPSSDCSSVWTPAPPTVAPR